MRLISDGEIRKKGEWRWGKRETIYLSLHCHHQNDFCIKMGSDESHFNVSVGSDGLLGTGSWLKCCFTSTETVRLIRDGEKGGKGVWRWGKNDSNTYRYTVTTRMIPALRWAAT